MVRPVELRRRFLLALWMELRVIWPILSGLIVVQLALGIFVGYLEGWSASDATYFTFVTGLTIGYGDLVPVRLGARLIAVAIGFRTCAGCRGRSGYFWVSLPPVQLWVYFSLPAG